MLKVQKYKQHHNHKMFYSTAVAKLCFIYCCQPGLLNEISRLKTKADDLWMPLAQGKATGHCWKMEAAPDTASGRCCKTLSYVLDQLLLATSSGAFPTSGAGDKGKSWMLVKGR